MKYILFPNFKKRMLILANHSILYVETILFKLWCNHNICNYWNLYSRNGHGDPSVSLLLSISKWRRYSYAWNKKHSSRCLLLQLSNSVLAILDGQLPWWTYVSDVQASLSGESIVWCYYFCDRSSNCTSNFSSMHFLPLIFNWNTYLSIMCLSHVLPLCWMQELGADVNLYALVFGESVLNDAVCQSCLFKWHSSLYF